MPNTKGNGRKISKMDMVKSTGQIKQYIKGSIKLERNMEKVYFYGKTIALMRASFFRITFMDLVNIPGKMEGFIRENGKTIKCKGKESLLGLMDVVMKDNIRMIKKKA